MQQGLSILKFLGFLALALALIAALSYLIGALGTVQDDSRLYTIPTISVTLPAGTPVARLAQIDPAVIAALDAGQQSAPAQGVQPIGAYLPSSGNVQFDLPLPTMPPTLIPYPTSPPIPVNPLGTFVPTAPVPNQQGVTDYGGDGCAPSGNAVDGILTQRFHTYHSGIDIGVPLGTPIYATHSGVVTFAGWSDVGYGYLIIIQNGSFITYYAHQTSFNVVADQYVGKGSLIGWSGSTGNSSGPHLHYETRIDDVPVNPLSFEARGYQSC